MVYVVKLAVGDLADYLADGKKSPDLHLAPVLDQGESLRVKDVYAGQDGYLLDVVSESGKRDTLFMMDDASEWFVTTDPEVSALG